MGLRAIEAGLAMGLSGVACRTRCSVQGIRPTLRGRFVEPRAHPIGLAKHGCSVAGKGLDLACSSCLAGWRNQRTRCPCGLGAPRHSAKPWTQVLVGTGLLRDAGVGRRDPDSSHAGHPRVSTSSPSSRHCARQSDSAPAMWRCAAATRIYATRRVTCLANRRWPTRRS